MSENLDKHLNHEFYREAAHIWQHIQLKQIKKGAEKYPEPFNPDSWSSLELVEHAIMENVDQLHYIIGLYDRIRKLEEENRMLNRELENRKDA